MTKSTEQNQVLQQLSAEEKAHVQPMLTHVELPARAPLQEMGSPVDHIYFMQSGMVSLVVPLESGAEIEVGTLGLAGIVNATAVFDNIGAVTRTFVQVEGEAHRMELKKFQEAARAVPRLLNAARRQVTLLHAIAAQSAACISQHEISERMARWLLHVEDEIKSPKFSLTQVFMADMLGVRRPTVSTAAMALQLEGAISYSRGRILIQDRSALENSACECYGVIRALGGPADAM